MENYCNSIAKKQAKELEELRIKTARQQEIIFNLNNELMEYKACAGYDELMSLRIKNVTERKAND